MLGNRICVGLSRLNRLLLCLTIVMLIFFQMLSGTQFDVF